MNPKKLRWYAYLVWLVGAVLTAVGKGMQEAATTGLRPPPEFTTLTAGGDKAGAGDIGAAD